MRTTTGTKLAIAGIIAVLFSGLLLRMATRLLSVAMHSLFTALLLVVIVVWLTRRMR